VVSDRAAGAREIAAAELARHLASRRHETPEREQARERDRLEKEPGEPETIGERRHQRTSDAGECGDADRERGAAGEQARRRATTEASTACPEQPAEPRDGVKAVGRIAERQIDRQGQQQDERRGDDGAQDLGNEIPASFASAGTSIARATASARRS
jgi:hypothetical protein